ncbi:GNAT family N-acetyltransferase [Amycolatopsis nivea]|uniref:GNAT family N-acetyltransferase n=1 Tax=Amycolatopsis nivea TaxID=1644109 RepID=UPI00106F3AD9|nr:GNAT family N-acetyltransferase [Amycolatopsis nivea]
MTARTRATGRSAFEIEECPLPAAPAEWDDLAAPTGIGFYSARTWNLAMLGQNGAEERVLVVRDAGGTLRAIVPLFRYRDGPANAHLHPGTLFGGADRVTDEAARRWEPVTVVGNASGYGTAPVVNGGLEAWAAAAESEAAAAGAGTAFAAHLTGPDMTRLRELLPGRPVLLTAMRISVPVHADSEREYEAGLRKRDRDRVRWERRLLARGGRSVTVEDITDDNLREIGELQESTQRRHGSYGDADYFVGRYRKLKSVLGDALFAFVCRHEGRALGYFSCIRHGRTLVGRSAGLDYDRIGDHAEYFNLMIHEPVRYCLRNGLRELDLGVAGYRQKLLRGGEPVPVWSMLLRPPSGWSDEDAARHNRAKARELRDELGPMCPEGLRERLDRIADAGRAEL